MKKKIFIQLVFLLFSIFFSFLVGYVSNSKVIAQTGEDTYPLESGIPPIESPNPNCGNRTCDCGSGASCNADCSSCHCDPPCHGTGDCNSASNCESGNCGGGCSGSASCSNHKCSWDCHCGATDDDDDDDCTATPPTGLSPQTPTNNSSVTTQPNIHFSWALTGWADDCVIPATNNNYFLVCLGIGTTYGTIQCPGAGGGGCRVPLGGTWYGDSVLTGTCDYPYNNLDPGVTYHWYVKADNGGAFNTSEIFSFTTGGTLSGNVYQDDSFSSCASAQNIVPSSANWSVSCTGGNASGSVKPDPLTPLVTNSYACVNGLSTALQVTPDPPGVGYTVSASPPPGWTVADYCPTNSVILGTGNPQDTVNIYLRSNTSTWWQAVGADVRAENGGIESDIPSGLANPYLIIDGTNIKHGVAQATTSTMDLGEGTSDPDNWGAVNVGAWGDKSFGYDFWIKKLDQKLQDYTGSLDSLPEGLWKTTGHIAFNNDQIITGKVFLITDGNVTIDGNITVPQGSSLVVVAHGNIDISKDVTNLQGYYISDGTVSTGLGGDNQLMVEGGLIGVTAVSLDRNFHSETNNTTPAEQFVFRPDMLANLNLDLKVSAIKQWKEIAP